MNPLPQRYHFFNLCIDSEVPLPLLPPCPRDRTDWTIRRPGDHPVDDDIHWLHRWESARGTLLMRIGKVNGGYLLETLGLARFLISIERRRIDAFPGADCEESSLAHLLTDQVLPLALCHEGRVVIHASAVALRDGTAVAFAGPSGRGKSTLAAAFHRAGHRVFADDCLLLERHGERVEATAPYPSLRLWPDALQALGPDRWLGRGEVTDMAHYSEKKQLGFAADGEQAATGALPLTALFLLEEPGSEDFRANRVRGSRAIMGLVEALFALDVRNRRVVSRDFEAVAGVASALPVYAIDFPRDFRSLPEVLDSLVTLIES